MKFVLLLFICLSFCFAAYAQDKSKLGKSIVIEANLAVLDSAGKPVESVKREDVTIFENDVAQKLTELEKLDSRLALGIAVDNSNSTKWLFERLVQAAKTLVGELRDGDEAFLLRFVDSARMEIIEDFTSDKVELTKSLDAMYLEGGQSAVLDAVYLSTEKLSGRATTGGKRRYALLLISDCEERDSYYASKDVFALVAKSEVQIFPFTFTGSLSDEKDPVTGRKNAKSNAEKLARDLAVLSGGAVYLLNDRAVEADMLAKLKELIAELRSPYVVRYTPTNQKRDGMQRTIRVEIADGPNGEKRQGLIRKGYVVSKD